MKSRWLAVMFVAVLILNGCSSEEKAPDKLLIDESKDEKVQVAVTRDDEAGQNSTDRRSVENVADSETEPVSSQPEVVDVDAGEEVIVVEVVEKEEKPFVQSPYAGLADGWDMTLDTDTFSLPYETEAFEVIPQPVSLSEQYDTIINRDQITGFTENQETMLKDQGFVVMQLREEGYPFLKMHHSYELAEYQNLPVFITSDSVLHMYHLFYSESLKYMELSHYHPLIKGMTERLMTQLEYVYGQADEKTQTQLKYTYAYIAVADRLFGNETQIPEEVDVIVTEELALIEGLSLNKSVLYDKDVDYSQYVVRGHYTLHEDFGTYFKAMMWYSQTGFQLTSEKDGVIQTNYDQLSRSLMLTHLIFDDARNVEDWTMVYRLTGLYSGYSDDLNLFDLRELIENVYADQKGYEAYVNPTYSEEIDVNITEMRRPEIIYKISEASGLNMPEGYQFRMMGQRYTLDANIMQELMMPILRPFPTAMDVLTAFGNDTAEEVLYEYHETDQHWMDYGEKLEEMKQLAAGYDDWQSGMYNGWLWSIDAAANDYEGMEHYPEFMQTEAWSHKSLAAALGSYAELKHDNILYSKQPFAEAGGPMYVGEHHYVEPNVELYERLLWLIRYTKQNLKSYGEVSDHAMSPLVTMETYVSTFLEVSKKELAGETVTEEEFQYIAYFGGLLDNLNLTYMLQLREKGVDLIVPDTSALIADVATGDGGILEEAVGLPRELYAVCYVNGKSFLARGSVYSYFEFVSPERLTDEQWEVMAGVETIQHENYDEARFVGEQVNHLEMMPWMASYISDEPNNLEVKEVEIDWRE